MPRGKVTHKILVTKNGADMQLKNCTLQLEIKVHQSQTKTRNEPKHESVGSETNFEFNLLSPRIGYQGLKLM